MQIIMNISHDCEMLQVIVGDKTFTGNFWDFNYMLWVDILEAAGCDVTENEDWEYGEDGEDGEDGE